ncbi:MAG TPA: DUF4381 domain-containing protein, partial [Pseudomonadales bacterium]|nr:DUF4381 domain-containing protein [Pseudomonadales bacterium]
MPEQNLELHDIHLPAEPGWFPLAPGWWILLALLIASVVLFFFVYRKWQRQKRFQHEAISLIETILIQYENRELADAEAVTSISAALKRVAITLYGREKVAKLVGAAWLEFLDSSGKKPRFNTEAGMALVQSGYQPDC